MKNIGLKFLIVILVILILAFGALLALKIIKDRDIKDTLENANMQSNEVESEVVEVKEPQIFTGEDRPIAVMIDNHKGAVPQGGLNDAYIVYEIIVEGGETRLMALFKGKDLEKIGPVRSSRHYFLDYALENDAIYVHYGWSPQAKSDITTLGVNNINGITESEKSFWRTKDKYAPHNVATSTEKILEIAKRKGYRTTSTKESVLNYVTKEVTLEDSKTIANKVTIPYSYINEVQYEYDEQTGLYTRYTRGMKQTDWTTDQTVTVKNIIITKCRNTPLNDGENKDRQNLYNVQTLDGYYITNGKAIPITCSKASRSSQTVYKDLNGNEIEVNDGNTFIQICPINAKITFTPGDVEDINLNSNTTVE